MFIQAVSGGTPKPITPEGVTGLPSPDGTLVASQGNFYPADGGAPRPIPGIEADDRVVGWAAEPHSLFVVQKQDSGDFQVIRLDASGHRTLVHQIARVPGTTGGQSFAITPDGSTYVMTYGVSQADLFRVTGLN